jgi:hypothetical protein
MIFDQAQDKRPGDKTLEKGGEYSRLPQRVKTDYSPDCATPSLPQIAIAAARLVCPSTLTA